MELTQAQLRRAAPKLCRTRLDEFVASFNMWAVHYGIDTPLRAAHYLAQVFHESGALHYTEELASGSAYEGRKDLGNNRQGDGQRYKGRGYIQLTGRGNYARFNVSELCPEDVDVVLHPELVAKYPLNQMASMWFWQRNGLNELADRDNGKNSDDVCRQITRRINGGQNGLAQRLYYLRRFRKEFGIK